MGAGSSEAQLPACDVGGSRPATLQVLRNASFQYNIVP